MSQARNARQLFSATQRRRRGDQRWRLRPTRVRRAPGKPTPRRAKQVDAEGIIRVHDPKATPCSRPRGPGEGGLEGGREEAEGDTPSAWRDEIAVPSRSRAAGPGDALAGPGPYLGTRRQRGRPP